MNDNQIKVIKFRYSRFKSTLGLVLLLGLFWIVGIFLNVALLNILGLQSGACAIPTAELPSFWQDHAKLALAVSFLPFLLWMIVAVWLAYISWRFLIDAKGKVEIYDKYALLYFKGKVVRIENSTDINYVAHGKNAAYEIRDRDKTYYLIESLQELCEKSRGKKSGELKEPSSLNEAMDELIRAIF